jgi:F-type H+-transporting ATPase subunit delta
LTGDIEKMAEAYAMSSDMRLMMNNPLIREKAREAAVLEIADRLGLSPLAKNAVGLLTRRRRLYALPAIAKVLSQLSDERAGLVRATVISAAPLSEPYAQRLQRELEAMTGKKVVIQHRQDPSLIAGVVTQIGDRIIDGSARARLSEIRTQLLSN